MPISIFSPAVYKFVCGLGVSPEIETIFRTGSNAFERKKTAERERARAEQMMQQAMNLSRSFASGSTAVFQARASMLEASPITLPDKFSVASLYSQDPVWEVLESIFNTFNSDHRDIGVQPLHPQAKEQLARELYSAPFIANNNYNRMQLDQLLLRKGYVRIVNEMKLKPAVLAAKLSTKSAELSLDQKYPIVSARYSRFVDGAFNAFQFSQNFPDKLPVEVLKLMYSMLAQRVDLTKLTTKAAFLESYREQLVFAYIESLRRDMVPNAEQVIEGPKDHLKERFEALNFLMKDFSIGRERITVKQIEKLGSAILHLKAGQRFNVKSLDDIAQFSKLYESRVLAGFEVAKRRAVND